MVEMGDHARFAHERFAHVGIAAIRRRNNLHRHCAVERQLHRPIDGSHAALADPFQRTEIRARKVGKSIHGKRRIGCAAEPVKLCRKRTQ